MTNKTEMVSVRRELLEGLLHCAALSASAPYRELRAVLDAPAEDVRAVVEEPVGIVDESDDGRFVELIYGENGNPLERGDLVYRHPQRPIVLPERWSAQHFPLHMSPQDVALRVEIQNACLDAFEELNKC